MYVIGLPTKIRTFMGTNLYPEFGHLKSVVFG